MTNPVGNNPTLVTNIGDLTLQTVESQAFGNVAATGADAGTATLNTYHGVVTTTSLTTAAGGTATLTLNNNLISANSLLLVSIANGTNSAGTPAQATCTPGAGSASIVIQNIHATAALNGTLLVSYKIINP